MTNCIMGFAHGRDYNWDTVKPFVKSLRTKANYTGDIVVFTVFPGMDEQSKSKLREYQVTEIPVDLSYVPWGQGFMMARFWQQEKTISENPQWDRVMLVDTRDMIFQSDLSKFFSDDSLHCAQEAIEIWEDSNFNSTGIRISWGDEVFNQMSHKRVLNSGSFWGGRNAILGLLNKMHNCGAKENCDQHALMYCVYQLGVPAILHDNDGSMIWTIGVVYGIPFDFNNGLSAMPDGAIPSIVHQYDRHDELKSKIQEYYK